MLRKKDAAVEMRTDKDRYLVSEILSQWANLLQEDLTAFEYDEPLFRRAMEFLRKAKRKKCDISLAWEGMNLLLKSYLVKQVGMMAVCMCQESYIEDCIKRMGKQNRII